MCVLCATRAHLTNGYLRRELAPRKAGGNEEAPDCRGCGRGSDSSIRGGHRIRGREFSLYYSGPHLHMVVLRENGATYWVVNTILDSLSNETMLAIARGLQPLPK